MIIFLDTTYVPHISVSQSFSTEGPIKYLKHVGGLSYVTLSLVKMLGYFLRQNLRTLLLRWVKLIVFLCVCINTGKKQANISAKDESISIFRSVLEQR